MKKIIFIVDEKKRDLLKVELIISKLKKTKYKFLVIQSNQLIKINSEIIKNGILIFPHFRINIMHYIFYYKFFLNCKIIIDDTEGAGDIDGYYINRFLLKNKKYLDIIDQYWIWGSKQFDKIPKNIKKKTDFILVGFMRSSVSFIKVIKKKFLLKKKKKYILINSNFPITNPKYTKNFKSEIKAAINADALIPNGYVNHLFSQEKEFQDTILKLSNIFKNKNFIFRPHPFESEEKWKKIFKLKKNILVKSEGDVSKFLINCELLIHSDCTTAVEAYFLNIPSISLDWLHNHKFDPQIPRNFSLKAKNFSNLTRNISTKFLPKRNKIKKYLNFYSSSSNSKMDPIIVAATKILEIEKAIKKIEFKFLYAKFIFKYFVARYLYMFKIKKIPYKPDKLIGLKDFVTIKLNQIYYSNSVFYIKI